MPPCVRGNHERHEVRTVPCASVGVKEIESKRKEKRENTTTTKKNRRSFSGAACGYERILFIEEKRRDTPHGDYWYNPDISITRVIDYST